MYRDAQERWKNTLGGLQTTMQMQAQVSQNLGEDESVLADLVGRASRRKGALQAMQAMNQLLALQAKQSIQSQRLQITQDRAASLELARQAAATERAREVRRRFLGKARRTRRSPSTSTATDGRPPCDASSSWCRAAGRLRRAARPKPRRCPWPPIACGSRRLRAQCAADRQATGEDACRAAAKPSGGASFPARPGRMNTRRWPTCRRSRPASMNRRARHETT